MGFAGRVVQAAVGVSQVSDGVEDAIRLSRMAASGARGTTRGGAGLYRIGTAARATAYRGGRATPAPSRGSVGAAVLVGGSTLYHGDADRARVLDQLDREVAQFRAEVEPQAATMAAPPARRQWWIVDVVPVLTRWAEFRAREAQSWMTRFATEWSTYVAWAAQIRALRSGARLQGIALVSPEPAELPETALERGSTGRGGFLETLWTILKTIVYAAVGVVGVYSLYSVYRDVRGPKETQA